MVLTKPAIDIIDNVNSFVVRVVNPNTLIGATLHVYLYVSGYVEEKHIANTNNTSTNTTYSATFEKYPSEATVVKVVAYVSPNANEMYRACDVTESVKAERYRIVSSLNSTHGYNTFLKAFLAYSKNEKCACTWEKTQDGVAYEDISDFLYADKRTSGLGDFTYDTDVIIVRTVDTSRSNETLESDPASTYISKHMKLLTITDENDAAFTIPNVRKGRVDILPIQAHEDFVQNSTYRFSVYRIDELDSTDPRYDTDLAGTQYLGTLLSQKSYTLSDNNTTELLDDPYCSVLGKKLYYKKAMYSYGDSSFTNNILPSDTGSFRTPLFNIIDLGACADTTVTTLIPWRDTLLAATDSAIYSIAKADGGYYTKVINTSIGIPEQDAKTCCAILNGILFKSHRKLYTLQPNIYTESESVLNLSEISLPIEDFLEDTESFAFTTEKAYYLFMLHPDEVHPYTTCLKYEYTRRLWTKYVYNDVLITGFDVLSVDDIRVYTSSGLEMYFEKNYSDVDGFDANCQMSYGDVFAAMPRACEDWIDGIYEPTPIPFRFDTGQKTDMLGVEKQFTETKIVFGTKRGKDTFPLVVSTYIDGNLHPNNTTDVATDSSLWKTGYGDIAVLNTDILTDGADIEDALRGLFIRFSGRGKSIRHVITGESICNFKLYEMHMRYKRLNTKL